MLPEKEARAVASQIFDGLAYLNGPTRRIIHYDLKPANILFNQLGEVKITVYTCWLDVIIIIIIVVIIIIIVCCYCYFYFYLVLLLLLLLLPAGYNNVHTNMSVLC